MEIGVDVGAKALDEADRIRHFSGWRSGAETFKRLFYFAKLAQRAPCRDGQTKHGFNVELTYVALSVSLQAILAYHRTQDIIGCCTPRGESDQVTVIISGRYGSKKRRRSPALAAESFRSDLYTGAAPSPAIHLGFR